MSHHHDHDHSHGHSHSHAHDHGHGHAHDHDHEHEHDHEHAHDHGHGHVHEHHHDHAHQTPGTLSFEEKMIKLLAHWVKHNEDHADSYRDWAQKAQDHGMTAAGALLEEVAELTGNITGKFEEIVKTLKD